MTTLKEIEERLGHLHDTSICTAEDCFRREHGDLLIRAVRQLGEYYQRGEEKFAGGGKLLYNDKVYGYIDPDVLELLEEL